MTNEEYLRQAYRLDNRIRSGMEELNRLRKASGSLLSPKTDGRETGSTVNGSPSIRSMEKIRLLEQRLDAEIDTLVDLKEQIRSVIAAVEDPDEQIVLRYRYLHNMTWQEIGDELCADESTIRRWNKTALSHVVLPETPIRIGNGRTV